MHSRFPTAAALAITILAGLAAPGLGQVPNYAFTPAGTRHFIGNSNNTWPFSGASARYQQIHDAVDVAATNGRRPLIVNGMSFRPDGIGAVGARQWDLQVTFGHTAVTAASMTITFSTNFTLPPTVVLPYKTVSVPAAPQGSTTVPNPISWTIPFASLFFYTAPLGNLCWEWQSRNATSSSTPMDACTVPRTETPQIAPNHGTGCTAAGRTQPASASFVTAGSNFASSLVNGPSNAAAMMWVGLGRTEFTVANWCAPLLQIPLVSVTGTTDAGGTWGTGAVPIATLDTTPYAEIYAQYGFVDGSLPGGVGLSDLGIVTTRPNQASFMTRMASPITGVQGNENVTTGNIYRYSGLVTILNIL
jgi:hypothetical protein